MCYSKEASFLAWGIALGLGALLWRRNKKYDRWNAAFLWTFTLVQFFEGFVWVSMEQKNKVMNSVATAFILLVLVSQPLVQTYMGWTTQQRSSKSTGPRNDRDVLLYMLMIYAGIFGATLIRLFTERFHSTVGRDGHLVWHARKRSGESVAFLGGDSSGISQFVTLMYLLGLFVPLLFMEGNRGLPLIAIGIGTALYSWARTRGEEFSSMWCFTSVIYGAVALML